MKRTLEEEKRLDFLRAQDCAISGLERSTCDPEAIETLHDCATRYREMMDLEKKESYYSART